MSSGKFLFLIMNSFFLFAFLTIVYFVKTISTGRRCSPWIKGKSHERDEMQGVEEEGQPKMDEFEGEEEEVESNSGDSSYDEEESIDEVAQCSSTPVAGIKSAGEYDAPIVSFLQGNTGNKSKTKVSCFFVSCIFFLIYIFPPPPLFWKIICFPIIYSTF